MSQGKIKALQLSRSNLLEGNSPWRGKGGKREERKEGDRGVGREAEGEGGERERQIDKGAGSYPILRTTYNILPKKNFRANITFSIL